MVTHSSILAWRIPGMGEPGVGHTESDMTEVTQQQQQQTNIFKKTRDTKGTFHAKMGSIKDRNGMDLTEKDDIKKSWQEYTELYKKIFTTKIITMV